MKQTAVEWLVEQMQLYFPIEYGSITQVIVNKAKEMEKEQIIKASIDTIQYNENMTLDVGLSIAKKYYQETYKK